jgi:hypothetical protein
MNHRMVTLHNGQVVSSWSEDWRLECEAMHVLDLPKNKRAGYLNKVEDERGKQAVDKLKEIILAIHNKRKHAQAFV